MGLKNFWVQQKTGLTCSSTTRVYWFRSAAFVLKSDLITWLWQCARGVTWHKTTTRTKYWSKRRRTSSSISEPTTSGLERSNHWFLSPEWRYRDISQKARSCFLSFATVRPPENKLKLIMRLWFTKVPDERLQEHILIVHANYSVDYISFVNKRMWYYSSIIRKL